MAQFKFKRGQLVTVTNRDGEKFHGKIKSADVNLCTYRNQYDVDYMYKGRLWTTIGVPESAINLR